MYLMVLFRKVVKPLRGGALLEKYVSRDKRVHSLAILSVNSVFWLKTGYLSFLLQSPAATPPLRDLNPK